MLENMLLLSLLLVLYLCCKYILFTQTESDNPVDKKKSCKPFPLCYLSKFSYE